MRKFKVWLKNFDPSLEFVVAKRSLTMGGVTLTFGDPFDKTWVTTRRLRQLYDSRRIATVAPEQEINQPIEIVSAVELNQTNDTEPTTVDLVPEIVTGPTGYKSVMVNGEKIGKSSRDDEVIKQIVDEWLAG